MSLEVTPSQEDVGKSVGQADSLGEHQLWQVKYAELQSDFLALNERFNYLQKATQDALWDWDLEKNSGWYSEGLRTIFGYDPAEIRDSVTFWYDNIHPEDRQRVIYQIHSVIDNGGKNWNDQYRFKRSNGMYAWVYDRGYAIHNAEGKPIRMVGSMQDISREMEARLALRESEEKFRATFDQAAVGISIATLQGEFLAVNKAYPKIFGFTEEEIKGKKISDLSHPEEIQEDRKIIEDLLAGKSQLAAREKRYLHKSGRIVWGRVLGTVVYDYENKPKYILGVLEDITGQRDTLTALRENEERLRLAIDSAKLGTWDFDPRTGNLVWDTRCKEMFGLHPDDHVDYEIFLQGIHPDDRQAADQANRDAIAGAGDGEYDLEYRTIGIRDQKLRWVRAKGRSYKDENGQPYRYAGTVIDITDRKEREQRLREQEERFRLLATSIPQIVWTTDKEGIVDYMSDKWFTHTGQIPTYEKFSFRTLMHPDDIPTVLEKWDECLNKGVTFEGEYRLRNIITNTYRWYQCTTVPLKNELGEIIKWIGSATDIHDQKMIEISLESKVVERTKALTELNHRLERSNSELEQYAYVTSHDLKEPLRKIQTYKNLIGSKFSDQLPEELNQYLKKIDSAAQRMSGLIEDLLKYSKVSNPVDLFEDVDLNILLQHVAIDFDHMLKEKNIALETTSLPLVRGVPIQMHQLFVNLVSNSIKFSKPSGSNKIRVFSSNVTKDEVLKHPALKAERKYHKIVIEDEGIGFSSEFNEQIFTIFQRLNNRRDYDGHGIGLALCRKIVSNHDGIISATGEAGKGARFTIILPYDNFTLNRN